MRHILTLLFALLVSPVLAADWGSYENARFGYVVAVPADFDWGDEAANGDGRVFTKADGTQVLRVFGGNVVEDDFEAAVRAAMGYATDDGWALSYERVTPSWASYSGLRNGMILYVRTIALCGGTQFASFTYEYPKGALRAAEPVVDRLVGSLQATGNGVGC